MIEETENLVHEVDENGNQFWYKDGLAHREDGPAVITRTGTQAWYQNGQLHREDGPAVIYPDGKQEWWIDGKQFEFRGNMSLIFGWDVNIQVDSDGHLNIYITNKDKTDIVECDTGQGDGCDGEQLALRFSTNRIEDEYKESN